MKKRLPKRTAPALQPPSWKTIVIAAGILAAIAGLSFWLKQTGILRPTSLAHFLKQFGPFAVIVYLFLAVIAVMSPMPDFLVSVAGGYIFGPFWGMVLSVLAQCIGTSYNFYLARKLGRRIIHHRFPGMIRIIDTYSKHLGWQTVTIMRIVPSVTFDIVGYAAGLSSMPYGKFLAANILGVLPIALIQISVGSSFRADRSGYLIPIVIVALTIIAAITLISRHVDQSRKRKPALSRSYALRRLRRR